MNIQPIDLPALVRALIWPLIAIIGFIVFRRPLGDLVRILGQKVRKFSVGGLSLELAEISEMKAPQALETEIRQLDAGLLPQSGPSAISGLLMQLQHGERQDYIVIDLGSESSPRWLTSRLYLLALLITSIDRPLCLVFVETAGGLCNRFSGLASPDQVRKALGRSYSWLESAGTAAFAILGGLPSTATGLLLNPPITFQFDPATGLLNDYQVNQFMQQFLTWIRVQPPLPGTLPGPVIASLSPLGGPAGTTVTITGAKFGDAQQPTKAVTFNQTIAVATSWNDTQIVATVPSGATTGNVVVVAGGLASNGLPFTVGPTDSAEWVLLPSGVLEHTKWLDGSRLRRVLGNDLNRSCVVLLPNKTVNDLADVIVNQKGRYVAAVDPDKTFRGLVDRSAVLETSAREFVKQAGSSKS